MRRSGFTRITLLQFTILKLIGVELLNLSVDKYKRGSAKDFLVRFKWTLSSDDDEHFYCYENDSFWNHFSW